MKASLLNALRKGTNIGLKIDSHTIVLVPHQKTHKGGGVYDNEAQTPRPPQQFSVEQPSGGLRTAEGALLHQWDYELVGAYNAAIAIGDTWTHNGMVYRVTTIMPDNGYEKRAAIVAVGKDPAYGT
ncbi:head-to-tail stopper [Mycobacterium phage Rope]|uniref:Head-to-tail stopper n=3 Tax=Papyrusvirus TaxID=1982554 RepID=A0A0Y0DAJ2_9CAUD|nr:hypothetical protein N842_gp019 [Mycobacterium phage Papyrus]AGT14029.1 hypothetical protein PAPYRUS_19 [Mycobacterium phage Papyrus]AMB17233.1 hypothetical protein SEA_WEISS13_19 [Mycobacterium phage Weiss13]QNN99679.1 head-to-tail stopper [Mycobacterium phage Rope]